MDRREFVRAGVAASVVAGVPAMAEAPKVSRPNVLYVFSDQHRAASLPGEPYNQALAPNLEAFRKANFSMDTCVSNYPLCVPYRGILATGRYPCQTGMTSNAAHMKETEYTLSKFFKANGYHTGYVGKWHLGHEANFIPKGPLRFDIDDFHPWADTNNHYHAYTFDPDTGQKLMPEGWNATAMTDQAVKFLKAQPTGPGATPWFLTLSWNPPHPPFNPPDEDQKPYPPETMKYRPNVQVPAKGTKPLHSDKDMHEAMQGYYGGITGVDLEFARVLKTLEETGQAANTIVIYTSDHGEMMGSHGRMSKQVPYEESCRVPFMVRYPGKTVKGGSSKSLFAAIDIYPTVCGLAGLQPPPHCEGTDFSGIMLGKKVAPREIVFLMNGQGTHAAGANEMPEEEGEGGGGPNKPPTYRGCRTDTHTYAVTEGGRWLLFDNVADPYQMKNLASDPASKPLMESLDVKIQAWMKKTGDKFPYPALA